MPHTATDAYAQLINCPSHILLAEIDGDKSLNPFCWNNLRHSGKTTEIDDSFKVKL